MKAVPQKFPGRELVRWAGLRVGPAPAVMVFFFNPATHNFTHLPFSQDHPAGTARLRHHGRGRYTRCLHGNVPPRCMT